MYQRDAGQDLAHHHDRRRHRHGAVGIEQLQQRATHDVFEHHVRQAFVHAGFEHRHDVGVAEFARGLRRAQQQRAHRRIRRFVAKSRLDGDVAPELGVVREIDHALRAAAQYLQNAEPADDMLDRFERKV